MDPFELNKNLRRVHYQMPVLEEIMPHLTKARVFTKLDAKNGFWQLRLSEKSSDLTAFWTPFGRYVWKVLPFGVAPAPEIYQQKQHEIVEGLKGVYVMADDMLVIGRQR